jgi:hypothetical protein
MTKFMQISNLKTIGVCLLAAWITSTFAARAAEVVEWSTAPKATVVQEARAANKFILMVGGSVSCGNCNNFKHSTVNITRPPVQQMIMEFLYTWYVDVDVSQDWRTYVNVTGDIGLPILALIDPVDNKTLDSTSGDQDANSMVTWCQNVLGPRIYPKIMSPMAGQVLTQPNLAANGVMSPLLWVDKTWYRLDGSGAFQLATGKTNWSVQLNGLAQGPHSLEIYSSYYTGLSSRTSVVQFAYQPVVLTPPAFTTPLDATKTAKVGDNVIFAVAATGTDPLTYSWTYNGGVIPNQTSPSLVLNNVAAAQSGVYAVTVSNIAGSPITSQCQLTVKVPPNPPAITTAPLNQSVKVGANVTFSVEASSTGLTYQWQHANTNLPNQTLAVLSLTNVQFDQAGEYRVNIVNEGGNVTAAATLTVLPAGPAITQQPQSVQRNLGDDVEFSVLATTAAAGGITYQWFHNQQSIPNETSKELYIPSIKSGDEGEYYVTVTDTNGTVKSAVAMLTLPPEPLTIISQPVNVTAYVGETATFSVTAKGNSLQYQWYFNNIKSTNASATSAALVLNNLTTNMQGEYFVRLTSGADKTNSAKVQLVVLPTSDKLELSVKRDAGKVAVHFTGMLQSSDSVDGPYEDVLDATSPFELPVSSQMKFYRAKK